MSINTATRLIQSFLFYTKQTQISVPLKLVNIVYAYLFPKILNKYAIDKLSLSRSPNRTNILPPNRRISRLDHSLSFHRSHLSLRLQCMQIDWSGIAPAFSDNGPLLATPYEQHPDKHPLEDDRKSRPKPEDVVLAVQLLLHQTEHHPADDGVDGFDRTKAVPFGRKFDWLKRT